MNPSTPVSSHLLPQCVGSKRVNILSRRELGGGDGRVRLVVFVGTSRHELGILITRVV